jgi:hypothetical protein
MPGGLKPKGLGELVLRFVHEAQHASDVPTGWDLANPRAYVEARARNEGESQYSEWKTSREIQGSLTANGVSVSFNFPRSIGVSGSNDLDDLYRELVRFGTPDAIIKQLLSELASYLTKSATPSTHFAGQSGTYEQKDIRDFIAVKLGLNVAGNDNSDLLDPRKIQNVIVDPNDSSRWSAQIRIDKSDPAQGYTLIAWGVDGSLTAQSFNASASVLGPARLIPGNTLGVTQSQQRSNTSRALNLPGSPAPYLK